MYYFRFHLGNGHRNLMLRDKPFLVSTKDLKTNTSLKVVYKFMNQLYFLLHLEPGILHLQQRPKHQHYQNSYLKLHWPVDCARRCVQVVRHLVGRVVSSMMAQVRGQLRAWGCKQRAAGSDGQRLQMFFNGGRVGVRGNRVVSDRGRICGRRGAVGLCGVWVLIGSIKVVDRGADASCAVLLLGVHGWEFVSSGRWGKSL